MTSLARRPVTMMVSHLAVTAAQQRQKGEPVTTPPTSWTSPRPKSAVSWKLPADLLLNRATMQ